VIVVDSRRADDWRRAMSDRGSVRMLSRLLFLQSFELMRAVRACGASWASAAGTYRIDRVRRACRDRPNRQAYSLLPLALVIGAQVRPIQATKANGEMVQSGPPNKKLVRRTGHAWDGRGVGVLSRPKRFQEGTSSNPRRTVHDQMLLVVYGLRRGFFAGLGWTPS